MPTPDLISRAARFFVLAEQASRLDVLSYTRFWYLYAPPVVETTIHLPALTAAFTKTFNRFISDRVASQLLPDMLPQEAVPWLPPLVAVWEVHRTSSSALLQNIVRLALVRLDGCGMPDGHERPSRLPEWLAEARKIVSGEWRVGGATDRSPVLSGEWQMAYRKMEALAALATWRPAPRGITSAETLRAWVDFWLEMRRSDDPVEKGIATIALLNLPEDDLRAASISPVPTVDLLHHLTTAIQVAVERTNESNLFNYLYLLDWQPATGTTWPVTEVRRVADAWLEVTKHENWRHRCTAWEQLIQWDRAGSLDICGMNLLPELVKAVPTEGSEERSEFVLWQLAQWVASAERLTATGTPVSLLRDLETAWERHRTSGDALGRASAWLAGIRLRQAGLASEPPENFLKAYLSTVEEEWNPFVVLILAQWSPGVDAPESWCRDWHAAWQRRLLDKDEFIRQIAAWAFLRQSLEQEEVRSLRGAALELWRAGTKASSDVKDTLSTVFARLHEVQACLVAGEVVDFEEKLPLPTERRRPPLALPPGRIMGREWQMENEKLKMGNEGMKHQEVTVKPNHHLNPNRPSR